ncbi:MAG: hypothetical protein WKF60_07680, partial [Ilumatobacter sp.]
ILRKRGNAIDVEIWSHPSEDVGHFLEQITRPLGLDEVRLADGKEGIGFICEQGTLDTATDITDCGE